MLQSNDRDTPEAWFKAQAAELALKFEGFQASQPPNPQPLNAVIITVTVSLSMNLKMIESASEDSAVSL